MSRMLWNLASNSLLSESDKELAVEMGRLTESMQGLRDAIHRQEKQLNKFIKNEHIQEMSFPSSRKLMNQEHDQLSIEQLHNQLENQLHRIASDSSHVSHWSCSLDTINSSIGELKSVLKKKDDQVIRLITENEELKNELKKKEKELKKQKFLVKAERETFEQYKKDTFNEVTKSKSEEHQDNPKPDKTFQEIVKLKSELRHFKQMYLEEHHTTKKLSKLTSSMKQEKLRLKDNLFQQEKQYNKFILEMAQRFDISRKEFIATTSNKFASLPTPASNLAICKIAERNARLAHDNCMLRLEVTTLKQRLFENKGDGYKIQTTRSEFYDTSSNDGLHYILNNKDQNQNSMIVHKSSSMADYNTSTKSIKCELKSSVTSLIDRNLTNCTKWHADASKNQLWDSASKCSEVTEVMRTESAPQLCVISNSDLT